MAGDARHFGDLFYESPRNGLTRPKAIRGAGVKMVNMGELFAFPRLYNTPMDRVPLSESEAERFLLKDGDLLFARQSLVLEGAGKCSIFLGDIEPVTFESHLTRVRLNPGKADPRFYFYYLQSHHGRAAIRSIVEQGAGASGIRGSDLARLDVQWRPVKEQRVIAQFLGTLDDRIELNRRMNETLEAMARALFKSWFVDFNPVHAKAQSRDPGLPKSLADLFPDSFEVSELGEIPKGWRLSRLGDEVETLLGGTPSRGEPAYWGGEIPWINSGKANEFRIVEPSEYVTQAGLESSATKLMPARTTVIAITGATLGQVSITEIPTCANQSIVGVLGSAELPSEYIYFWVKENIDRLIASQTGGAQQHINKNDVNELPVICPNAGVVRAYLAMTLPMFERIKVNCFESRNLAALRDTLLPRLVSGDLRIPRDEMMLAAAAV